MRRVSITVFVGTVLAALASSANDPPAAFVRPPIIRAVAFSPDGRTLVAGFGGTDQASGAVCWEVATGKRLWRLPGTTVTSLSFAPDGRSVAVARGTPSVLRLDSRTGKTLGEIGP